MPTSEQSSSFFQNPTVKLIAGAGSGATAFAAFVTWMHGEFVEVSNQTRVITGQVQEMKVNLSDFIRDQRYEIRDLDRRVDELERNMMPYRSEGPGRRE